MLRFLRMRRLFNRHVGKTTLWIIVLLVVAGLVNAVGIRIAGDIQGWTLWLKTHAPVFLFWRLCLYVAVAYGWWWMRQRVIQRETDQENRKQAKTRFMRMEISAVCALLLLEISNSLV